MSDTNKPASGEPSPIPSQDSLAPLKPRPPSRRKNPENIPYDWMDYEDLTPAQAALKMSNELLARKMAQVQANMARLKREISVLNRHIKEFDHPPLFETWEADILTRLVEVACAAQPNENLDRFPINLAGMPDRETVSRAYVDAAKQVQEDTLYKLGLTHQHYLAIDRYEEVAAYRSDNPSQTETPFAKWLLQEKESRPTKYDFWAKLYPICYGRSVEQSASIF